jgi:aminoglycoside phosphotransferase (APT) family kinase protein
MPADPFDAQQVSDGLLDYLRTHVAPDGLRFAEQPERIGRGMDTHIYAFRIEGDGVDGAWAGPLVLRLYHSVRQGEKAAREAAVQRFAVERGYPAVTPLVFERIAAPLGLPIMVMARAPGVPMLERMGPNPLAIARLLANMAELHVALHRLPVAGCPLPSEGPLVERRLQELRAATERAAGDGLGDGLRWLEAHKGAVIDEEASLCHNDFHPLNILVADDGAPAVLDWSDATVGDRHHDIARTLVLFWVASIAARSGAERILLRLSRGWLAARYLNAYRRLLPVDPARLRYWQALQAFDGWRLVADLKNPQSETIAEARADSVQQLPASLLPELRDYFWRKTRS